MLCEQIHTFYKRAVNEQKFSKEFLAEAKSISSEDKLRIFFENKVLPIAKSMGYDFSVDDLISYEQQAIHELNDEDLERISGGTSLKGMATTFMSFLMLVGNINPMSNAIIPKADILASAERLGISSSSVTAEPISTKLKDAALTNTTSSATEQKNVPIESDSEISSGGMSVQFVTDSTQPCKSINNEYVLTALNLLDPYALKTAGTTTDIRFFDGNTEKITSDGKIEDGKVPIRKYNEDQGKGSPNFMRTLFPSSSGELSTEGGYDKFTRFSADCNPSPELVARIASYFHKFRNASDQTTMMKKLSDYEKYLNTNLTDEKLKAYHEINQRSITKSNEIFNKLYSTLLEYKKYQKNFEQQKDKMIYLKALADTSIEKEILEKLESSAQKDVNQITDKTKKNTKILSYVNKDKEVKSILDQIIKDKKTEITFEEFINASTAKYKTEICDIYKNHTAYEDLLAAKSKDEILKKINTSPNLLNIFKNKDEESAAKPLEEIYKFFEDNNMSADVIKQSKNIIDFKKAKAIITLLKEGTYMIQNQETDDDKGSTDKYPKYTTERTLMSYFIDHFNTSDDITKFYDEIDKLSSSDKTSPDPAVKNRLDILSKVIKQLPTNENIPSAYNGAKFIENGPTKTISEPKLDEASEKEQVSFSQHFADCVDTVVRHFLNLLFYDPTTGDWLPEVVNTELADAKKAVIDAINDEKKTVEFKSLKERVQMFFTHQTPSMVNNGSEQIRTLWNYVISNMHDSENPDSLDSINYIRNKNYELEPGYINMLKLIYQIEKALYSGNSEKSDVLSTVKTAIENLIKKQDEKHLKTALEAVIKVVKPNIKEVTVNSKDLSTSTEFYGDIEVTLKISDNSADNITFNIYQHFGHAKLQLVEEQKSLDLDLGEFNDDPIISYLIKRVFKNTDIVTSIDSFYEKLNSSDDNQESKYLAKSHMLRLLKELAGENVDNYKRIYNLCEKYFSNVDVAINDRNLSEILLDLFRKSTIKQFRLQIPDFTSVSEDGNYSYITKENGIIEIHPTDKLKGAENITIPANIDGYNKYIISPTAFFGFNNLKTLTFESGIESLTIGDFALSLSGIKELTIPENITECKLGIGVFHNTNDFEKLIIPANIDIEIGKVKFETNKLDKIVIPENIKNYSIPDYAFSGLKLPQTVTICSNKGMSLNIGQFAFKKSSVETLNIVGDVKKLTLKDNAFTGFQGTHLKIPDTVETLTISENVFANSNISTLDLSNIKNLTLENNAFAGFKGTDLKIPDTVETLKIPLEAFKDSNISNLDLGNVKYLTLYSNAFKGFKRTDFRIPDSVKNLTICNKAFENSNITNLDLGNVKTLTLLDHAFTGFKGTNLKISDTVETLTIPQNAFKDSNITNLDLGKVKNLTLEIYAFTGFKGTDLKIPDTVKTLKIPSKAFKDSNITNLDLGNMEYLAFENNAFTGFKGTDLKIPDTVKTLKIPSKAFKDSNILKLDLSNVKDLPLEDNAFAGFKGTDLKIPDTVETLKIGEKAFANSNITNLDFGSVKDLTLNGQAFAGFKGTDFKIPDSVETLNIAHTAFANLNISKLNLSNLKNLTLGPNVFKEFTETDFKIPDTVETLIINDGAFCCSNISNLNLGNVKKLMLAGQAFTEFKGTDLKIPDTVETLKIGEKAFANSNIINLDLGSVKDLTLNGQAFVGFKGTDFKIPDTVETLTICNSAFVNSNISNLDLGNVKDLKLDENAFKGFKGTDIKIPGAVKTLEIYGDDFANINISKLNLGSLEQLTLGSNVFKNFTETDFKIPDTVKTLKIDKNAFANSNITNLDLGNVKNLTLVSNAFTRFKGTDLKVPDSVETLTINRGALIGGNIKTLDIEANLENAKIEWGAFAKSKLEKIIVHYEASKKLLEDNKAKYGIADSVAIELDTSTQA